MAIDIKELSKEILELMERHGFNKYITEGAVYANFHSEVSEAWEEIRNNKPKFYLKNNENGSEASFSCFSDYFDPTPEDYKLFHEAISDGLKPEGEVAELADIIIRVLHWCAYMNYDIESAIELKMLYNAQRAYRHGNKKY